VHADVRGLDCAGAETNSIILRVIDGLEWVIDGLHPYLYPNAHLGFLFITFFGELVFLLWLLIRGWKIKDPA